MKNYYDELISLLTFKSNGKYLLNSDEYLQIRFFIDTISQSERFIEIVSNKFNDINLKSDPSRSIDLNKVFKILNNFGNSVIHEFIDLMKSNKCISIYSAFNSFRNNDYRSYIKSMKSNQDFSLDNDRIKFQYIYVTPTIGSYIMLVDDDTYLENLDNIRVTKGLRELTNLGNIKKSQEKKLDRLREDLDFESCYV